MSSNCFSSFEKYLLLIFNISFMLYGIALLAIGSIFLSNTKDFSAATSRLDEILVTAPTIITIFTGVVIIGTVLLGWYGAVWNNKAIFTTFAVLLVVIVILQIADGISALSLQYSSPRDQLNDIFEDYELDESAKNTFNALQTSLHCCGVMGEADYGMRQWPVPKSCCVDPCTMNVNYQEGCAKALQDWNASSGRILGGLAMGLLAIDILGIILALYEIKQMRAEYSVR